MNGVYGARQVHGYLTHDPSNVNDSIRSFRFAADTKIGQPVSSVASINDQPTVTPINAIGVLAGRPRGIALPDTIFGDTAKDHTGTVLTHRGSLFYTVKGDVAAGTAVQLINDAAAATDPADWKVQTATGANYKVGIALDAGADGDVIAINFFDLTAQHLV